MSYWKRYNVKLTNDFHGTETVVHAFSRAGSGAIFITRDQALNARRKLCGIKDCTCGDVAGCRPSQVFEYSSAPDSWIEIQDPANIKALDGLYQWTYPSTETGRLYKVEETS